MSHESKTPKIENLALNKETVQDLAEEHSEQAKGGAMPFPGSVICHTVVDMGVPGATCLCDYTKK
jgi:hypothetical protein